MTIGVERKLANHSLTRSAQTLIGICSGLTADGSLNDHEIRFLHIWLRDNAGVAAIWPGSCISARVEQIMADGVITDDERTDLLELLQQITSNDFVETGSATPESPGIPFDEINAVEHNGRSFCLTGTFFFGTRAACEKLIQSLGATPASTVTGGLDYLVVGGGCSPDWFNTSYGRKIETAMERKSRYGKPLIISEARWMELIGKAP